jgi:hypothetical protein
MQLGTRISERETSEAKADGRWPQENTETAKKKTPSAFPCGDSSVLSRVSSLQTASARFAASFGVFLVFSSKFRVPSSEFLPCL